MYAFNFNRIKIMVLVRYNPFSFLMSCLFYLARSYEVMFAVLLSENKKS